MRRLSSWRTARLSCATAATTNRAERLEIIIRAIASVVRPLLFSLLIILASFLPIFFLGEREARLFDPLAFTKTAAMAFSTLLTVVLLPILIVRIPRWPAAAGGAIRVRIAAPPCIGSCCATLSGSAMR